MDLHEDIIPVIPFGDQVSQEEIAYQSIYGSNIVGGTMFFGSGDSCLRFIASKGLWMGNANFDSASFRVSMSGSLTVDGGTITGGIIQTSSGNDERVVISSANNTITFYNDSNEIVSQLGGGTDVSYAFRAELDASTATGVRIVTGQANDVGYRFINAGNYNASGAIFEFTGATNQGTGINIDHDGDGGRGINVDVSNGARGIEIANSGDGRSLSVISSSGASIYISHSGDSTKAIEVLYSGTTYGFYLASDDSNSNDPAFYVQSNAVDGSVYTGHFHKTNFGAVLNVSSANSSNNNYTIGIRLDLASSGTSVEGAFEFAGSEYIASATGVSGLTGVVKVITSDGLVYMPVYSSYS